MQVRRRKRKREDELTGIRRTSKAKNNEANREYRSPGRRAQRCNLQDGGAYRSTKQLSLQRAWAKERNGTSVLYEHKRSFASRWFLLLASCRTNTRFLHYLLQVVVVVVRNIQILFYETTSLPSNLSLCAYGFSISKEHLHCVECWSRLFFSDNNDMKACVTRKFAFVSGVIIRFYLSKMQILQSFDNYIKIK